MAFKNVLLSSAALLLAGIASAAPTNCFADVRVISVRGSDEPYGHSCLQQVFTGVLQQGVNAVLQGTPYPAQWENNDAIYSASVAAGVGSLTSIIQGAVAQCPNQKIALIGYSQGAQVISDTLNGYDYTGAPALASELASHINAVVLFGDPTHASSQSFVTGGGEGRDGMVPRKNNPDWTGYDGKVLSICHAGDPVCALGADFTSHTTYMVGDQAAQFIRSKTY